MSRNNTSRMRGLALSQPSLSKPTPVLRAAWATNRLKFRRSCDEEKRLPRKISLTWRYPSR